MSPEDREINRLGEENEWLTKLVNKYESALLLIAAPTSAHGTYKHDRAACQKLAEEVMK